MSVIFPKYCYYLFGLKFPLNLLYLVPVLIFYPRLVKLFKNNNFRIFFILLPSILIFFKLLRNDPFFLSDDFAHLNLVANHSYYEITKIVFSRPGIWVGHHIVTAFWLFKLLFDIFGTKVEVYLLANFLLQAFNLIIFYKLLEKVNKGTFISVLTTFLLGTYYLTWISNMHEILGGTFLLLSLYFWRSFISKEGSIVWVIICYFLAIVSKEITFLTLPAIGLFTVYYHFNVRKLKFKKYIPPLLPLILIFVSYFLHYAWRFVGYSHLPADEGYKIAFLIPVLIKNATVYTSMLVPFLRNSAFLTSILFIFFVGFDFLKKRPITTPFLLSYFMFLIPPSLFTNRISNYYTYIPSFFLFMGIALIFWELARLKLFSNKFVVISSLLVITTYIFGINRVLMDNCFLIEFPWQKPYTKAFYSLRDRLDKSWGLGELKAGKEIKLSPEEQTEDMQALYEMGSLQLFLYDKKARGLSFVYNKDRGTLEVNQK